MLKGKKKYSLKRQSIRTRQMLELSDREFNITVVNIYYNWVLQREKKNRREGTHITREMGGDY